MDGEKMIKMYAAGHTAKHIALELGESYLATRNYLRSAGVLARGRRPLLPDSVTDRIVELHDSGMPMSQVASHVGLSVPGAWSRYKRAQSQSEPVLGRWQIVLTDALKASMTISVALAVADHLGRPATRAESNAAHRAAHSLVARGLANEAHVPFGDDKGDRLRLVLMRPDTSAGEAALLRRAIIASDPDDRSPNNQPKSLRRFKRNLRHASAMANRFKVETLDQRPAAQLADDLASTIADLERLRRRADRQARRALHH